MLSQIFDCCNEKEYHKLFRQILVEHLDKYPYDFDIEKIEHFVESVREDFPSIRIFDEWLIIAQEFDKLHKHENRNFQELKMEYLMKERDNRQAGIVLSKEEDKQLRRNLKIKYEIPVHNKYFDYWGTGMDVPKVGFEELFEDLTENYTSDFEEINPMRATHFFFINHPFWYA
jgi:hypothetical protein